MKTFSLELWGPTMERRFEDVVSFIGEDESGQFGIRAGRHRLIAPLVFGLARFQTADERWSYLALPGGTLYCRNNLVSISTNQFFLSESFEKVEEELHRQLESEAGAIRSVRESLSHLEEEVMRRLRGLKRT